MSVPAERPRPLRKALLRAGSVVLGVALALASCEAALTVHRLLADGEVDRRALAEERDAYLLAQLTDGGSANWENDLLLHPYFGYTWNPRLPRANNFGFTCRYDFERVDDAYALEGLDGEDLLVVGIFGGSFAEQTALEGAYLEQRLADTYPGRKPVVVNFAIGGHALPQAGYIFLYFREMLDAAVFVDGLNELWNAVDNNNAGFPPEFAKAVHFRHKLSRQELSPETFERTARMLEAKRDLVRATEISLLPVLRGSLVVHHFYWGPIKQRWGNAINNEVYAIQQLYQAEEPFFDASELELLEFAAARWETHHRWIHGVAAASSIPDFHLLQPNPHVPDSKTLTGEEREATPHPSGHLVELGYPLLRSRLADLRTAMVAEDLSYLLRDRAETLWKDGAHLNAGGYRIVLDRVFELLTAPGSGLADPPPQVAEER